MENKNTMLLTVIAVATLLVAVVGATFAYFTVSQASGTATTTVTAQAEDVGTVLLKETNGTLTLEVTAAEMAQTSTTKNYYAVASGTEAKNSTEATPVEIANATITTPGEANYTCTATFTVAKDGGMAELLQTGDAKVELSGAATKTFDLSDIDEDNTVEATFHLNKSKTKDTLSALVSLNNTGEIQNNLAGQELSVTISASGIKCTIDK